MTGPRPARSLLTAALLFGAAFYCAPERAAADPVPGPVKYPLVFTSLADLEKLGLWRHWPLIFAEENGETVLPKPPFQNGCYWWAGNATRSLIAVSDDVLERYKKKGFTRESLCMALASRMRFDPETGERLPTYIYRDDLAIERHIASLDVATLPRDRLEDLIPEIFPSPAALQAAVEGWKRHDFSRLSERQIEALQPEDEFLSDELPLKVPDCFKNGTPYLDCNWRYGLLSGKKLSDAAPLRYRQVGQLIDEHMTPLVQQGSWATADISPFLQRRVWGLQITYEPGNPQSQWKYIPTTGWTKALVLDANNAVASVNGGQPLIYDVGQNLHLWAEEVTWFDVSPNLPRGYGYNLTLHDEGFGDAGISAASILAAFDTASSATRLTKAVLKQIGE